MGDITEVPNLNRYLQGKPLFDYDLFSQADGLAQVLKYVESKLHGREKQEEVSSNANQTDTSTDGDDKTLKRRNNVFEQGLASANANKSTTDTGDEQPIRRYSALGALPRGTLSEQERGKLLSHLSNYDLEEKQLNDKSRLTRDRQSKNGHVSDYNYNATSEIADSRTSLTNSPSTTPALTGGSLSQEDNIIAASPKRMNELNLEMYPQGAMTCLNQFDCSRFLFSHLGLLTPGQVLGMGDFDFSFIETRNKSGASKSSTLQSRSPTLKVRSDTDANELLGWDSAVQKIDVERYQLQLQEQLLGIIPIQEAETLHKRLDLMDRAQNTTREFHKIGVEFVGRDQDQQHDILGNNEGSYCYEKLIDDLGWIIDLSVHEGFVGGLSVGSSGRYACYYGTGTYEMIFHVATRMLTREGDTRHTERKRHVANDHVNIVWTEHTRTYLPDTISTDFNTVNIVIYPLQNGLFRIQIHKKGNVANFGPLTNNMVVRQHVLAPLVRLTALEANRTVQFCLKKKEILLLFLSHLD
ncbi:hypothetical protein RFI_08821 [Reticulomyxa filosa]|uniref:Rap-GAP domain-containing protein n=1 Tax=Reticulomyxa filosa TaxID=46433 RepID=X6NRG0_RETFI|nr:hypothetical protein RFI_08821 [Reticulomyxa filosa]|eukprot:ETO28314.1 hypothetical protein RFI_08821 [Reticulomyxa filosa]